MSVLSKFTFCTGPSEHEICIRHDGHGGDGELALLIQANGKLLMKILLVSEDLDDLITAAQRTKELYEKSAVKQE